VGGKEGEHPWGDAGQLVLLGLFLVVWIAVSTASLAALALTALIFAFYDHIASYEERWLEARYGEAYRAYRSRTGKWWPVGRRGVRGEGGS